MFCLGHVFEFFPLWCENMAGQDEGDYGFLSLQVRKQRLLFEEHDRYSRQKVLNCFHFLSDRQNIDLILPKVSEQQFRFGLYLF